MKSASIKSFQYFGLWRKRQTISVFGGILFFAAFGNVAAQRIKNNFMPYSTVGFGVGTASYYGDLAGYLRPFKSTFGIMRWNISGEYSRHFTPRLAARASITWARIAGDDYTMNTKSRSARSGMLIRNLHFRNDLKEFAITGIFRLIPEERSFEVRPKFGAYLFAGVALLAHNPMARSPRDPNNPSEKTDWVRLKPLNTEGQGNPGYADPYSLVTFAVPFGFGVSYKVNAKFTAAAELGFRFTTSDYLDDAAGNYADPELLTDPLAQAMAMRALEPVTARKGESRTNALVNAVREKPGGEGGNPYAFLASEEYSNQGPYGTSGTPRGQSPQRGDTYMLGTFKLIYTLGTGVKCPPTPR